MIEIDKIELLMFLIIAFLVGCEFGIVVTQSILRRRD